MHVPFAFVFTPATPGTVLNGKPLTKAGTSVDNYILSQLDGHGDLTLCHLDPPTALSATRPLWVREFSVTSNYGVTVSVAFDDGTNVMPLFTTLAAFAGAGGHTQPFTGEGVYVPKNLRVQITAGADADNTKQFIVAGHLDLFVEPT